MEARSNKCASHSPEKQAVKNRSMSTGEIQRAKKAFGTPQTSLPVRADAEKLTEMYLGSDSPSSSSEKLK